MRAGRNLTQAKTFCTGQSLRRAEDLPSSSESCPQTSAVSAIPRSDTSLRRRSKDLLQRGKPFLHRARAVQEQVVAQTTQSSASTQPSREAIVLGIRTIFAQKFSITTQYRLHTLYGRDSGGKRNSEGAETACSHHISQSVQNVVDSSPHQIRTDVGHFRKR